MPFEKATVLLALVADEVLLFDFCFGCFFGDEGVWFWAWLAGYEVGGAQGGGTVTGVSVAGR